MTEELTDVPSPFAPIEEWQFFLADVKTWKESDRRSEMIALAEAEIKRLLTALSASQ